MTWLISIFDMEYWHFDAFSLLLLLFLFLFLLLLLFRSTLEIFIYRWCEKYSCDNVRSDFQTEVSNES